MSTETKQQSRVMPAGLPFLAAGAVWFVLAMLLPIYKLSMVILAGVIAAACGIALSRVRAGQIAALPPAPTVKERTEELAKKLDDCRDDLREKANSVKNAEMRALLLDIAETLSQIADDVENDPKDRHKVRKLANHYTDMISGLAGQYLRLEGAGGAGENVSATMEKIEDGLRGASGSLKALLDNLFGDDAMEVNADIAVLEQLLDQEEKLTISGGNEDE